MANPFQITKIARWQRVREATKLIFTLALLLGFIYPSLADGFGSIYPFINGFFIGVFGGLAISLIEFYVFYSPNKRYTFLALVGAKAVIYTVVLAIIVLSVLMMSRALQDGITNPLLMYTSPGFQHFVFHEDLFSILSYALLFTFLILFLKEISRKLGREVLSNFITGKYYKPRKEKRIFMFIDLNDSTSIAEKMNDFKYHNFVNEFFKDITESIIFTKGEIYQYVGDEIVVSWPLNVGVKNGNCIYTYFYAVQSIQKESIKYLDRYSIIPKFKAAIHWGSVIRGEVGDVKSEIVFSGDVMNTTSRIEKLCGKLGEPLLVSGELFDKLPDYIKDHFVSKGGFMVKGKEKEIQTYGLIDIEKTFIKSDDVKAK